MLYGKNTVQPSVASSTVINPTATYVTPTKVASVAPIVIPSVVQPTATYVNTPVKTKPSTISPIVIASTIASTPTKVSSVQTLPSVVNPTVSIV